MSADLATFRLRPATSGRWASLILSSADAVDVAILVALLEDHAARVPPDCDCPGPAMAASALLEVPESHPSVPFLEAVLVALVADEGGQRRRMN